MTPLTAKPKRRQRGYALMGIMIAAAMIPVIAYTYLQFADIQAKQQRAFQSLNTQQRMNYLRDLLVSKTIDADSDGRFEPLKEGASYTIPSGIPSAQTKDEWGTEFRYCTWDLGTANGNTTYSQNNTAPPKTDLVFKLISAGKNKTFETACTDTTSNGDDLVTETFESNVKYASGALGGWVDDGATVRLLDQSDKVGIGTATPAGKLDVAGGNLRVLDRGDGTAGLVMEANGYSTHQYAYSTGDYQLHKYGTGSPSGSVLAITNAGKVGIGNTNPATPLDVTGQIKADSIYMVGIVTKDGACNPNGQLARDTNGKLLYCESAVWTAPGGGGGGGGYKADVITSSGNFTVPAGVTEIWVSMCGGGGGAAGGNNTMASGGGSGHNIFKQKLTVTPGQIIPVTIGGGGTGGSGNPYGNGSAGETTSFGSYLTAPGGGAGRWGKPMIDFGSEGGGAAGGSLGEKGESAYYQTYLNTTDGVPAYYWQGGKGGDSLFGFGGRPEIRFNANGAHATGYCAGGGGTSEGGGTAWGGNGSSGLVIVEYSSGGGGSGSSVGGSGTGTPSYLPKWTDASTLGNSIVYDNGTNVGVGTTSPSSKLDVVGDIRASGTIRSQSGNIIGDTRTIWTGPGSCPCGGSVDNYAAQVLGSDGNWRTVYSYSSGSCSAC